jgi:hypothetical protein
MPRSDPKSAIQSRPHGSYRYGGLPPQPGSLFTPGLRVSLLPVVDDSWLSEQSVSRCQTAKTPKPLEDRCTRILRWNSN